jgi:hypothetical protein
MALQQNLQKELRYLLKDGKSQTSGFKRTNNTARVNIHQNILIYVVFVSCSI